MSHREVFSKFQSYFPDFSDDKIDIWFQNGKNSIRVRLTNQRELIFTYSSDANWRLQTINNYIECDMNTKKCCCKK